MFWWQDEAEGQGPPGWGGGLNCVSQKDTFKRVALFGDRVTADVIEEDEGPLGYSRPFIKYDCCPCKKGRRGTETDPRRVEGAT